MNAPEADVRLPDGGGVVATGLAVVVVAPPPEVEVAAATDEAVVAGLVTVVSGAAELDEDSANEVDVDESALFPSEVPDEQPAAITARTRKRTRRFTGAHHRAPP
jgi:hypothetical protein